MKKMVKCFILCILKLKNNMLYMKREGTFAKIKM